MLIVWSLIFVVSLTLLIKGADWLVESPEKVGLALKVSPFIIGVTIVAIGTSLPELVVSVRAAAQKKYEIALGNIFGSNVFSALVVIGIPAIIKPLLVDSITFQIGFPFMVVATILLVISGITRRISIWEGSMFLLIYLLFPAKLFGWF